MKTLLVSLLTAGALLVSGSAWAQFGKTNVPSVTVPSTTQGTSNAATQAASDAMMKEQKEKAMKEAEKAKKMAEDAMKKMKK